MSGEKNVSKAEKQFFADLNNSKKVWSFALKLSLFTHRISDFTKDFLGLDYEIAILKKITGGRPLNPTDVFRNLFSFLEVSSIHALIDHIDPLLERDLNKIRDANYIFIDAVDQSISQLSQDSWVHFQAGLIEAAYDLMRSNQHVKVYASIRIEAFATYTSPTKANVSGYTTKLFYDKSELYDILNHLSGFYEESMNIDDFLGHKVIRKKQQGIQEEPFNYLIRHTLSTPRELVHICRGLSESSESCDDETVFRQIVNERSANHLPNVFHELRPILKTLNSDNDVDKLMSLLSNNIIDYKGLKEIIRTYNGYEKDIDIDIEHLENPFLDLYNCGLLGVIDSSIDSLTQRFHTPSNPNKKSQLSLPQSEFYFVHPSLQSMVQNQNPLYKVMNSIVIGQNLPWYDWNQYLIEMEHLIDKLPIKFDGQLLKPIRSKINL
jgi:hypothetical protein